jgi:hypothetical protein
MFIPDPTLFSIPDPTLFFIPDPTLFFIPDPTLFSIPDPTLFSIPDTPLFSIPDPNCLHFGYAQKNYFIHQKWFLTSRKYDPGCSSRIPDADFLHIPDPGSRGQKGTGSATVHNTELKSLQLPFFSVSIALSYINHDLRHF